MLPIPPYLLWVMIGDVSVVWRWQATMYAVAIMPTDVVSIKVEMVVVVVMTVVVTVVV